VADVRSRTPYGTSTAWTSLPDHIRSQDLPTSNIKSSLKAFLFEQIAHGADYIDFTVKWTVYDHILHYFALLYRVTLDVK